MVKLPVFCKHCGKVNAVESLFEIAEGVSVTINMVGSKITCPNCGKLASIIDGNYEFIGNAIRIITTSEANVSQLRKLISILEKANKERTTPEEISKIVKNEIPEIGTWFPSLIPKTTSDFYAALASIIAILGLYVAYLAYQQDKNNYEKEQPTTTTPTITNNITNNYYTDQQDKPHQKYTRPKKFRKKQPFNATKKNR